MRNKSNKFRVALTIVSSILCVVLLGGVIASVVTKTTPLDWFKKDDAIVDVPVVDEPVVEEVLPFVATTEEEMNALLIEENVGRTVTYTGETIKNVELPFEIGDFLGGVYLDTSVNIDDWLLGLCDETAHYSLYDSESGKCVDYYFLVTANSTIDEIVEGLDFERRAVFWVIVERLADGSYAATLFYATIPLYNVFSPNFNFDVLDGVPELGWTEFAEKNMPCPCEADIVDIAYNFLNFDELFLATTNADYEGFVNNSESLSYEHISSEFIVTNDVGDIVSFDFGSLEIIYETDVEYLIVANESDEGFHFEVA